MEYEINLRRGHPSCGGNPSNSCARDLCECDRHFAAALPEHIDYYTDDYHLYWSPSSVSWKPDEDCVKSERKTTMKCCGGGNKPWFEISTTLAILTNYFRIANERQMDRVRPFVRKLF